MISLKQRLRGFEYLSLEHICVEAATEIERLEKRLSEANAEIERRGECMEFLYLYLDAECIDEIEGINGEDMELRRWFDKNGKVK